MLDMNALSVELIRKAAILDTKEETLFIKDYLANSELGKVVSESELKQLRVTPGIENFVDTLPEIKVDKSSRFSLMEFIDDRHFTGATDSDLSMIATSLYKLILQTNFDVLERNRSSELPDEIELGYEARVNQNLNEDFVFANPNDSPYIIKFELHDNQLSVTLTGADLPYRVAVVMKDKQTFKPRVIKQYSPYLNSGEVKVTEKGKEGLFIEVWRSFEKQNGEVLDEKKVSEDYYPPVHMEVIYSLQDYKKRAASSEPSASAAPK